MKIRNKYKIIPIVLILLSSCTFLRQSVREANTTVPSSYGESTDTNSVAGVQWRKYFNDPYLIALIDTALKNNQELNIMLQEIEMRKNEIRARKGEYLPSVNIGAGAGMEKSGLYTRYGAVDEQLSIKDGKPFPEPFGDFKAAAVSTWELDIWRKLRNAKDAAIKRYLAGIEGRNFMVTQLVSEIAQTYYELLAYDNFLKTINENIVIQSNALNSVKLLKENAKVTQLAVNRFEAQLLKTTNLQYEVKQKIIEAENRINFLTARYPLNIERSTNSFLDIKVDSLQTGIPSQLLSNRPDLRQAELELAAAKLDVKVARANFYPSLGISAGIGYNAFNPAFLVNPQSLIYNLAGDLMSPLINRNAIKATYFSANAQQLQSVINYEKVILNAYVDVQNQMAKMKNYSESYAIKSEEVRILNQSIGIANSLFNSARADYVEVLLTQEEALEAKLELIEVKTKLLQGKVGAYRALGGGWR